MFVVRGDISGRHNYPGKPAVNPLIAALAFGGILIALKNYKVFYNQFFLCWCLLALIPANLTYPWENPNMLRTYTAIPPIIYFVGQTITWMVSKVNRDYKYGIFIGVGMLLLLSAIYDIRTYFVYQTRVMPQAFERENNLILNIESDYRNQRERPSR